MDYLTVTCQIKSGHRITNVGDLHLVSSRDGLNCGLSVFDYSVCNMSSLSLYFFPQEVSPGYTGVSTRWS